MNNNCNNINNCQLVSLSDCEMINIEAGGFWGDVGYAIGYFVGSFVRAQERDLNGIGGPTAAHT